MKYAIVLGSTREGRAGEAVAQWVQSQAASRDAQYELLDLVDYDLDLVSEKTIPGAANREYENPKTRAWGRKIDEFDGFIFVTPEYNHGVPAALKNAFDLLYPEWGYKSVGFVSYGADGGVRAVEQWRLIVANAHLMATRGQVSLYLFGGDFNENQECTPAERRGGELTKVFDEVERLAAALRPLRDSEN